VNVHLVDGTYELFRSFYGPPPARAPDGREVGATRGLMRTLVTLLREQGVTHVGCAFDHQIESFRNELFDGYKTGEGIDPDLWAQFPLAERVSRALGIVTWPMVRFEADDALATAAAHFASDERVQRVVICSPDKDLSQCVREQRVVLWDRRRGRTMDQEKVREHFGVEPASIADYLALVGDSADGIPGIERWGAKSAATVLARYGHLESIPGDAADWDVKARGAGRLAENLRAHWDDALLYRRLATLRTDVPLEESLDDLRWNGPERAELQRLCDEIGAADPWPPE
jgi:5'-3' exonuclease